MLKLFAFACLLAAANGASWTYEGDHGPAYWGSDYPDCLLQRQSPIDIRTDMAYHRPDLTPFTFTEYDSDALPMTIENNGHTVKVSIGNTDAMISGGGLIEDYHLAQFHFHWGSSDTTGSEHFLDQMQYPMEVHFVHFANSRGDLGQAANTPRGLAVLGFFFRIGTHNANFEPIVAQLSNIRMKDDTAPLTSFRMSSILPLSTGYTYYRYDGSLTTPGCYESVVWTVFEDTIEISSQQMEAFRNLIGDGNHTIVDNYRPLQELGSRTVFTNDQDAPIGPSDAATALSASAAVVTVVCATLLRMLV